MTILKSIKFRMKNSIGFFCSFCILAIVMTGSNSGASCNWSCDIRIDYPCPTWSEPLRFCEGHSSDSICVSNRMACRGTLSTCVASGLVAYSVSAACVASVVGVYVTDGTTWQQAALTCAIAAETIHTATQHCQ
jgi:hypothetical protein